jgi:hypothetical protein
MAARIKVHGLADGTPFPREMWVASFDVDALPSADRRSYFTAEGDAIINGAFGGKAFLTTRREEARRFADNAEAMLAWNTVSKSRPKRPDGRPNKPLTALTVEIEPCE